MPLEKSQGSIRDYRISDLIWLEAIAKKYNEWPAMLRALEAGIAAYVIEQDAIMVVFKDLHGVCLAGLCDNSGIRSMVKLSDFICDQADYFEIVMHGHWKDGTWQAKLAARQGFKKTGGEFYMRKPIKKEN